MSSHAIQGESTLISSLPSSLEMLLVIKLMAAFYGTLIAATLPAAVCIGSVLLSLSEQTFLILFWPLLLSLILMILLFYFAFIRGGRLLRFLIPLRSFLAQPLQVRQSKRQLYEVDVFASRAAIFALERLDIVNGRLQYIFSNALFAIMIMVLLLLITIALSPLTALAPSVIRWLVTPSLALPFAVAGIVIPSLRVEPRIMLAGYLATLQFYQCLKITEEEARSAPKYKSLKEIESNTRRDAVRGTRNYLEFLIRREIPPFERVDLDIIFCRFAYALEMGKKEDKDTVAEFASRARNLVMEGTHDGLKKCLEELLKADRKLNRISDPASQLKPSLGKSREEISLRAALTKLVTWFIPTIIVNLILI